MAEVIHAGDCLVSRVMEQVGKSLLDGQLPPASTAPLRHRMHRSAVRPFICCGSELSLVSLVDGAEAKDANWSAHQAENCSLTHSNLNRCEADYESNADEIHVLEAEHVAHHRGSFSAHRKKGEKSLGKTMKKFWSLRPRNKLSHSGSGLAVSTSSLSDSPQHQPGCICTAYKKKTEEPEEEQEELAAAASSVTIVTQPKASRIQPSLSAANFPLLMRNSSHMPITELLAGISLEDLRCMESGGRPDDRGERFGAVEPRPGRVLGATGGHSHLYQLFCDRLSSLGTASGSTRSSVGIMNDSHSEESLILDSVIFSRIVHTQVDYVHCLVPDLNEITNCSFYWGVMDRYEAERLLENKPEGTFLLRDSAQEEFLFSVSFRRYSRSLHARIEQWNHKFSFDAHDPAVFAAETVCGLIEHYKDPNSCMFFEPMLTNPMNRTFPFSLQHLCRSVIANMCTYDSLSSLPLPGCLKEYLRYYHYKQRVRVRRFDIPTV